MDAAVEAVEAFQVTPLAHAPQRFRPLLRIVLPGEQRMPTQARHRGVQAAARLLLGLHLLLPYRGLQHFIPEVDALRHERV